MMFTAKTIEQIKAENPNLDISAQWKKYYDENWNELKKIDEESKKKDTILWRFLQESVADGRAIYQIIGVNKNTVRIRLCEGFSEYVVPYWGQETKIDRKYAEKSIEWRDNIDKLLKERSRHE